MAKPSAAARTVPLSTSAPSGAQNPVSLSFIDESPTNPRKTFTGIEELAESLKTHGQLAQVLIRPRGDRFELVYGARRYRAAKLAGFDAIDARVRELSDGEALEIQLVENGKRADIEPLEEADGIRVLHEQFGYSIERIAEKLNKSEALVRRRLKLCALCPEGREAIAAGKLTLAGAEHIATVVPLEHQPRAIRELVVDDGYQPSSDEVAKYVRDRWMLPLARAPFPLDDAELVQGAGACTSCAKRSGAQGALFESVTREDSCTDRPCYDAKIDALFARRKAEAEAGGAKVIDGKAAAKIAPHGHLSYDAPVVDLDEEIEEPEPETDGMSEEDADKLWDEFNARPRRTWRDVLGEKKVTPTLVRVGDKVIEAVDREELAKAVEQVDPKLAEANEYHLRPRATTSPKPSADEEAAAKRRIEKEKRDREAKGIAIDRAIDAVVAKAQSGKLLSKALVYLARQAIANTWGEPMTRVATRRGLPSTGDPSVVQRQVDAAAQKMNDAQLVGLLVELAAQRGAHNGDARGLTAACQAFGVDLKALEKAARDELAKPKKAEPAKPQAKGAKTVAARSAKTAETKTAKAKTSAPKAKQTAARPKRGRS